MIIKFSLIRLTIIFLIVILFPLVQNQWLNLYLFDVNNPSIYKFLYYLSGLIVPSFVCISSLSKFTSYKFLHFKDKDQNISGRNLLIIILITLFTISTFISYYIFINFRIIATLFFSTINYQFNIVNNLLFIFIISILLLFKNTRLKIKRIVLLNYFIISMFIWYAQINNIFINNIFLINNKILFDNVFYFNVFYLFILETLYYIWSCISYKSQLSDWSVPTPYFSVNSQITKIIIFYLMIVVYYSLLVR